MNAGYTLIGTIVLASALSAMTASVSAQELPLPAVQSSNITVSDASALPVPAADELPAPAVQALALAPAAIPAKQDVAALPAPTAMPVSLPGNDMQVGQDGLHRDPRWPLFRNCIENTFSPQAFEACLQQAFLTDTTGASVALMPK